MGKQPKRKRSFGEIGLPVSQKYIYPNRRGKMIVIGVAAAAALVLLALLDVKVGNAGFICSGPLSYGHAELQDQCSRCHDRFDSVSAEKCSRCHERFDAEHGVYTLAAHYVYRSGDSSRVDAAHSELLCADCHVEHRGRQAELTRVSDERCLDCHAFGEFPGDHPEFAALLAHDDTSLRFPHILHVEVILDEVLEDGAELEQACLQCHRPDRRGVGFQPLDFESQCSDCHLGSGANTPYLRTRSDRQPGVETLDSLKSSAESDRWEGISSDTDLFRKKGDTVMKRRLTHEDPWILDNLQRFQNIRSIVELLSQLRGVAEGTPFEEQRPLYDRAIREFEELSRRSLVADERRWAQKHLPRLQQAREQQTPLSANVFGGAFENRPTTTSHTALGELAQELTTRCRECHTVDGARIVPVDPDLSTLRRAEFNHRAHVLVRDCLDCHSAIPIREYFEGEEQVDDSRDKAETHNLPNLANCVGCHVASGSTSCSACHNFHPVKDRASGLLASRELVQ